MLKRGKFWIGGFIVLIAVGYLSYMGFGSSAVYYYTVSEFMGRGDSAYGENVRVSGQVAPGSIDRDSENLALSFTIVDEGGSLPVVYKGIIPDAFKAGSEVVVEGKLNSGDIFQANTLLTKCPSKYVPEE